MVSWHRVTYGCSPAELAVGLALVLRFAAITRRSPQAAVRPLVPPFSRLARREIRRKRRGQDTRRPRTASSSVVGAILQVGWGAANTVPIAGPPVDDWSCSGRR